MNQRRFDRRKRAWQKSPSMTQRYALLEILLPTGRLDAFYLMPAILASFGIFICKGMAKMSRLRVGMTLDNRDSFKHRVLNAQLLHC